MMKNPRNLIIFAILGCVLGLGLGYSLRAITASPVVIEDTFKSEDLANIIYKQQADWNSGDIEGFMDAYWQSENLRFSSGGDVTMGWKPTISRYKTRYPDKAAMGTLEFKILRISKLSPRNALVHGRWVLERGEDMPSGLFTLHMGEMDGEWVIISDHTSSAN